MDANEFWSPKQAVRAMRALEREFDIAWCEEPVIRTDLDGLRDVSRAIGAAVATGENLKDVHLFAALLRHGAADIVQVNPNMAGLTTCLRAAELAQAFDRPVSLMNSAGRYGAHLAAALPHHTMMEVLEAGRDATFTFDSVIEDGWIVLGDSPGAGITFDSEALERHRVRRPRRPRSSASPLAAAPGPASGSTPTSSPGGEHRRRSGRGTDSGSRHPAGPRHTADPCPVDRWVTPGLDAAC